MSNKKNRNVDIHKRSTLHLMIGLVASVSIALIAFEWKSYGTRHLMVLDGTYTDFDPLTEVPPSIIEPPKPPAIQLPKIIPIPDEEDVDVDIDLIIDTDIGDETRIEDFVTQDDLEDEKPTESEFIFLEEEASFPGGRKAWGKFLKKNLKYYVIT